MKKIFAVILLIPVLFLFCAFKKQEKPYLVMSNSKITQNSLNRIERNFGVKQRIYYALIAPDGFKYDGIRMQISKQDDKTSNWGFSIINSHDIYIPKGDMEYRNYVVIPNSGHYIIQFFYLNNKRYPFIHREFMVD